MLGLLEEAGRFDAADLQPGDVLLCAGTSPLQLAISALDMSLYSHAALWTGESVLECVPGTPGGAPGGVLERSLPECITLGKRKQVAVMRWRDKEPARPSLAAVITSAQRYKGRPYALSDVMLMAFLILKNYPVWTKQQWLELRPQMPEMLRALRAAEGLEVRRGMTCSELVASAFHDADPQRYTYALRLDLPLQEATRLSSSHAASPPELLDAEIEELVVISRRLLAQQASLRAAQGPADNYRGEVIAGRDWVLHNVTPKDLRHSQSLTFKGSLELPLPAYLAQDPAAKADLVNREAGRPAALHASVASTPSSSRVAREVGAGSDAAAPARLLYVVAVRGDAKRIDPYVEYRAVQIALERALFREQFALCMPSLEVFAHDLAHAIDREEPTLLHFAGHGTQGGFALRDRELTLEDLCGALGSRAARIKLVTLNACETAELARGLASHVECAIGIAGQIKDSDAQRFAETLYLTLGNGRSVREAFDAACRVISDPSVPVLACHGDPARSFAISRRPAGQKRAWLSPALAGAAALTVALGVQGRSRWHAEVAEAQVSALARIPGGLLRPGSSEPEARAAYEQCKALEGSAAAVRCGTSFEVSLFAREPDLPAIGVDGFEIERVEVSNLQLVGWLNEQRASLRVASSAEATSQLKVSGAAVALDHDWIVLVKSAGQAADPAISIAYEGGRFRAEPGREREPTRMISWLGARLYCESHGRRLPTSDEWEWAARGGEQRNYPWGERPPRDCTSAVFGRRPGQACSQLAAAPAQVGTSRDTTPEGVYDLGGNVSEWVDTPIGPAGMTVYRGGNYEDAAPMLGAARRFEAFRNESFRQLGFRCARSLR